MDTKRIVQEAVNSLLNRDEEHELSASDVPQIMETLAVKVAQWSAMEDSYRRMKADTDHIAKFIRDNYGEEIKAGKHAGLRLSDVVIMYLSRERTEKARALIERNLEAVLGDRKAGAKGRKGRKS